jgi:1-acyl-sn-glycerol-3-phosphate acyltransferase
MYAALTVGLPFALLFKARRGWRAFMFHKWARGTTAILRIEVDVRGTPPDRPFLLVSNHLSYVDVLVFASQVKCVFVARGDLAHWPFIGSLCRGAGTIFVDRSKRKDVTRVNRLIAQAVVDPGVVLFAEGTSTRGDIVLPFKSSLLEQAARASLPVTCAALTYRTPEGEMPAYLSVCWWGDMTFVKHVIGLLYLSKVEARVAFGREPVQANDRKVLAERLWAAVKEEFVPVVSSEETARAQSAGV